MFGGKQKTPIIIRLIVGRGWGQGPTHSQNFQNIFATIPGLRVYIPSFPSTMRDILHFTIKNNEPSIIIEHRWLHYMSQKIDFSKKPIEIKSVNKLKSGKDLTIVSSSYSTFEILKLYKILKLNNITFDHLDLNVIKPFKIQTIQKSLKKTGKLLILDNSVHGYCSFGSQIISELVAKDKNIFKKEPINLTLPDIPSPSSFYLTKNFYNSFEDIIEKISNLVGKKIIHNIIPIKHDIPDPKFRGPF